METTTLPSCKSKFIETNKNTAHQLKIQIKEKICHSLLTVIPLYWDNSMFVSSKNSLNSRLLCIKYSITNMQNLLVPTQILILTYLLVSPISVSIFLKRVFPVFWDHQTTLLRYIRYTVSNNYLYQLSLHTVQAILSLLCFLH